MTVMHSMYREAGKVEVDGQNCIRCGKCVDLCTIDVLKMTDGGVTVEDDNPFGCVSCGHCMMVCPNGCITVTGRGASPEDLVPLPPPEERATADALAALMQSRRSIRRFSDREVDKSDIARVVEMAASAPMGIPPWDAGCVTVLGREKVRELAAEIIKGYEGFLKIFRPWLLSMMRPFTKKATYEQFRYFIRPLAELYAGSYRKGRDVLFYDAPAVMIFHHSPYAQVVDVTIACTYAMLAAESLGLGTTIIGGAPPILQRNKALCKKLGIPSGNTPTIALILGHPDVQFRRAIRRRFSSVETVC
ncbi:MAG TPA: nitroreductase family protein [Geobacteraceae bacterium]|nr:nitroreductase family protein [Geobacteraceae bacterium]